MCEEGACAQLCRRVYTLVEWCFSNIQLKTPRFFNFVALEVPRRPGFARSSVVPICLRSTKLSTCAVVSWVYWLRVYLSTRTGRSMFLLEERIGTRRQRP